MAAIVPIDLLGMKFFDMTDGAILMLGKDPEEVRRRAEEARGMSLDELAAHVCGAPAHARAVDE